MLSVIVPSRNERFTEQTVHDVLRNATGSIEVILILDGWWPTPILPDDPRLTLIHFSHPRGMRNAINAAAAIAKGEYLLKTDAHCMFDHGFDEILAANCDDDWVVIPRRHRLDAENWCLQDTTKPPVDYEYLSYPFWHPDDPGMHGQIWNERTLERMDKPEYEIDNNMSFQGSCWFMSARHFHDFLGGLSEVGYGSFKQEAQEIGLKTWLGGGQIKINKRTWVAHLHKGRKYGRGYSMDKNELRSASDWCTDHWMNNRWEGRQHDLSWLIEKFAPVPTWSDNWREIWTP